MNGRMLLIGGVGATLLRVAVSTAGTLALEGTTDKDPVSYRPGEPMTFRVQLVKDGQRLAGQILRWQRTGDDGQVSEGEALSTVELPLEIATSIDKPGFVRLQVRAVTPDGTPIKDDDGKPVLFEGGAGVEPAKIEGFPEPADFDAFWKAQQARLAEVPLKAELTEVAAANPGFQVFDVKVDCAGGKPVSGYLSLPRAAQPGSLRAQVIFRGYSVSGADPTCSDGCLVFHVNAHGIENGREPDYYKALAAGELKNYGFDKTQNAIPETAYFNGMMLRVMRALEFVKSRPEWDGRTLIVAGGSQGGFQALAAAALDRDVTQCNAHAPWCCDLGGTTLGRLRGWRPDYTDGLAYYDGANLAKRIRCETAVSVGLGDYTCPPSGVSLVYNHIMAPKRITYTQGATHGYTPPNPAKQVVSQPAPQMPSDADLANGGFEEAGPKGMPSGWEIGKHYGKISPGATFVADTGLAQEGERSLKMTATNTAVPAILLSRVIDVEAGAKYVLTAQVRGAAPATAMRMLVVPSDFKAVAQSGLSATNAWQRHELAFTAPSSGVMPVNLRFDLMEPGTVWIDSVRFVKTQAGTGVMSDAAALRAPREILDGGFEQTRSGDLPARWQIGKHYNRLATDATLAVDDTVAFSGRRSLKITSPSDEGIPAIALSSPVAVEPGATYVIAARMRSAAKTANAQILALRADEKGADRAPLVLTDQWRRYRLVFQARAEAYYARFDAGQGTIWIDDVSLTALDQADRAADGPALGYRYGDTPGAPRVTLAVGPPTGRAWSMLNGVCYHRGFGSRDLGPEFADTKIKVVRLHNVLTHQKILQKQADGSLAYDYTLLDKSIGEILAIGAVPQISLCFVPVELVDNPVPEKIRDNFYLGQPSDYGQWEAYIEDLVRHCRAKYPNMEDWYWIFGNEPGVRQFSMGTQEEFYRLYTHTLAAAVRAQPNIQIGAGSFAHPAWLNDFVARCAAGNTRVDLITWHHYDVVPEDYAARIQDVRAMLAPYPALARAKLAIDEWNASLPDARPAYFSAGNYAAAHAAATIYTMMRERLTYQTHFIAYSLHGWGMMHRNVKSPVFYAFQLLGMMGANERGLQVPDGEPYVGGFACDREDGALTILVWYVKSKNDIAPDVNKSVTVTLADTARSSGIKRYVIDGAHSNALADPQRQALETGPVTVRPGRDGAGTEIEYDAPPNSLSLLVIER